MEPAQRIVSLISSGTEILYLLGLGAHVVGVSHECDYPPEVLARPRLTRSLVESAASSRAIDESVRSLWAGQSALYEIDSRQLAALAPDLIITQAQCDVCAVRYEDVVAAVRKTPALVHAQIVALNPRSLADVFDDVVRIGRAAGVPAVALEVKRGLEARVCEMQNLVAGARRLELPRVACLEWIEPPMLAANWTPELVRLAGGEPGLTTAGRHSTYADWDAVVDYDPQIMVIMPCGFDLARSIVEAQVLPAREGWSRLSAVRDGRVFAVDGNAYFNRSGPRLVDSLEILAHLFHPELFSPPIDLSQQAWRRLSTRGEQLIPEPL